MGFPTGSEGNTGLNLQPSSASQLLPSPAYTSTPLCSQTPGCCSRCYFQYVISLLGWLPTAIVLGWRQEMEQTLVPAQLSSQPLSDTWTIQHVHCQEQMKQQFHKTPHTNLNLEISMKIPSLHDPKGHLTSFSLVIWCNSVQKTSPNNFSISSIISTGAVCGVKAELSRDKDSSLDPWLQEELQEYKI